MILVLNYSLDVFFIFLIFVLYHYYEASLSIIVNDEKSKFLIPEVFLFGSVDNLILKVNGNGRR